MSAPKSVTLVDTSLRDGIDTITDFLPGDRIVLTQLLQSLGINNATPIGNGFVTCRTSGADAMIGIDPDATGSAVSRSLVLLKNQSCTTLALPDNFIFLSHLEFRHQIAATENRSAIHSGKSLQG